ncbi:MAG: hypothetical protein KAT15_30175, partial [Bacteroidales bacterium]|nr:hypothetical protein [Bacteroidales bacterium]
WDAWSSGPGFQWVEPYENIGAFLTPDGKMTPLAYLYQFPACWIDFREKEDKYGIDYWGMGVNALQANRRLCIDWGEENDYHPDLWGWTACNGKNGYLGWGVPYNGTIAPSAAVASLPYMPEESLRSVKYMYDHHQLAWSKYGFVDAFDPGQAWYDNAFLGIDKGNEVLMIENYRNEGVWLELMKNPYVVAGMQKAGFIK